MNMQSPSWSANPLQVSMYPPHPEGDPSSGALGVCRRTYWNAGPILPPWNAKWPTKTRKSDSRETLSIRMSR